MAYKMNVVSPSSLAATEACPRFRPDGKENDAAQEGTLLHEKLEEMVQQPKPQWEAWIQLQELSAEHKGLLQVAAADLNPLVDDDMPVFPDKVVKPRYRQGRLLNQTLKPGLYPECEIETAPGRHGYIDLLIVTRDGVAIVIDYKMVRNAKDYELQLGAYAMYLHRLVPTLQLFECRIIAPRLYGDPEVHEWTADDLAAIEARIEAITKRADDSANDPRIAGHPGDACQYCHWNGTCPYQAATLNSVVPIGSSLDTNALTHPASVADRGMRRKYLKLMEAFVKAAKEDDAAWVEEHGGLRIDPSCVPGWKLSWRNGRASLDKDRMTEVRTALMEKLSFDIDDVMSVSDVSLTKIVERLSLKYGYSEKVAKAEIQKALDEFMAVGGKVLYWTQDSTRREGQGALPGVTGTITE